jgi:hypothetical protein
LIVITVYLDNNIWDFLYDHKLDLGAELPREEFCVCITRETEFEIPPIQSCELKAFIKATIERCAIQTDSFFGFNDDSLPQSEQRVGGCVPPQLEMEKAFIR